MEKGGCGMEREAGLVVKFWYPELDEIVGGFGHSYLRKATELLIALDAERKLGKDKILELYLNIISVEAAHA